MAKKTFRNLIPGTPQYVVAHAQWRKKRGKLHPSVKFSIIKNPARALSISNAYLDNYGKFPEKSVDTEYEDKLISQVSNEGNGWVFRTSKVSGCIWVDKENDHDIPKVGQLVRIYHLGHIGIGSVVRGLDLEGKHCRYQTYEMLINQYFKHIKDEKILQQQKFEEEKELLDKQFKLLPAVFQRRIERFRFNNEDFRWKYESIELELSGQAVALARYLHKQTGTKFPIGKIPIDKREAYNANIVDKANHFFSLPNIIMQHLVSELDDVHSGNSLAHVHLLSVLYLTDPKKMVKVNGCLSCIVGSEAFGDVPRKKVELLLN